MYSSINKVFPNSIRHLNNQKKLNKGDYLLNCCFIFILFMNTVAMAEGIQWLPWSEQSFQQAKQANKMIFVDVGIEGCTACRHMAERTFTYPEVIDLMNTHFVNIGVDAEANPDIGERYSDWAWPALIFLAPDATQVLAISGNRVPGNFIPILKELISKHQAGQLSADELAPYAAPPVAEQTQLSIIRDRVRLQLDRNLNEKWGGWSRRTISTGTGAPLRHLYMRAHLYDHTGLSELALKTSASYMRAIDPVWGGVFVVAFHPGDIPERFRQGGYIPEKRIIQQANAIHTFADAYQLTGDKKYLNALRNVDRYVREWMMAADGTFYTSQEDVPVNLPGSLSMMDYWALDSAEERLQYGVPPIDHAVYTDKNGQVISAYIRAYEATGDRAYFETGLRAAEALISKRLQQSAWLLQTAASEVVKEDKRMRPFEIKVRPYLSAQAWFGRAALDIYRSSGDSKWLLYAKNIANVMQDQLMDKDLGGFYATTHDTAVAGIRPRKPLEINAVAAHFFYDLWIYTKDNNMQSIPARAIQAVAHPEIIKREGKIVGELALVLEKITAAYVEFSIVGDSEDPRAQALFEAARSVYHPRKLVHFEAPGRYPARERPSMYICNPDRCSIPIEDPTAVAKQAQMFHGPAVNG